MRNINVKTVLNELQYYDVKDYDVVDLMKRAIRDDIKNNHKLFAGDKDIQVCDTIENSVKSTEEHIIKVYGSIDDARLYKEINGYKSYVWFNKDTPNTFKVYDYGISSFVGLIQFVMSGNIEMDRKKALEIVDQYPGIEYNRGAAFNISYPGIDNTVSCKTFKNGNVKVSGLTDEQQKRLIEVYNFYNSKPYNLGGN